MCFFFGLPCGRFVIGGARGLVDESESELLLSELSSLSSSFVGVFDIYSGLVLVRYCRWYFSYFENHDGILVIS